MAEWQRVELKPEMVNFMVSILRDYAVYGGAAKIEIIIKRTKLNKIYFTKILQYFTDISIYSIDVVDSSTF